jgi:hypothetical protein
MRLTQELVQSALFTVKTDGLSIPDKLKLSYQRAKAIARVYGSCITVQYP